MADNRSAAVAAPPAAEKDACGCYTPQEHERLGHSVENDATVEYEVWRSHPNGRDVRVYFGLSEEDGRSTLALCNADKAEAYPDAPVEFYMMRVTRTRERVLPSADGGTDE